MHATIAYRPICDADRGHAHLIVFTHACGYYSRAAAISFTELHVYPYKLCPYSLPRELFFYLTV